MAFINVCKVWFVLLIGIFPAQSAIASGMPDDSENAITTESGYFVLKTQDSIQTDDGHRRPYDDPDTNMFFPIPWKFVDIPSTPYSLPLPENHEIKSGADYPTVDVYSLSDTERQKHPKLFFGLFFDKPCSTMPDCGTYLPPLLAFSNDGLNNIRTVVRESMDQAHNIRLRHFIVTNKENALQKRHYFMIDSVDGPIKNTVVQVFPDDITDETANIAWETLKSMRVYENKVSVLLMSSSLPAPVTENTIVDLHRDEPQRMGTSTLIVGLVTLLVIIGGYAYLRRKK
jgi:hypothetical protein